MALLVQEYFSKSAARFPEKCAVSCESEEISYKDLEYFSNSMARYLRNSGVERGEFIPFFMIKSVNSIKSMLSILKADCTYIPIDINSPAQRLKAILNSANAQFIIVDNESERLIKKLLGEGAEHYLLVNIDQFESEEGSALAYDNLSIDLAYVLFTSGSTGVPKGVMIPHKAIIDYIDWCVETYEITEKDIVANHAPLYFDNSTFDLYTAFKSGATLHLVHEELNAVMPRLVKWLNERAVTVFFCVPSVLTMLLRSRRLKEDSFPQLKHIICAGEVLPPNVLSSWMDLYPHIQFTNMYGPTEITVDCCYYVIESKDDIVTGVPIGKPRRNMEMFVRDSNGVITQEVGVQGELLVRGTSVAYGYLSDPEKTEKVFVQNPNNSYFHDLLYCTGDMVSINEKGDFLFHGRADDQIKYLGYRIELGEIETIIFSIEGVEECVVIFNNCEEDHMREIGALIRLNDKLSAESLNENLRRVLPNYMVPTKILLSEEDFPKTPNGKYDRKKAFSEVFEK